MAGSASNTSSSGEGEGEMPQIEELQIKEPLHLQMEGPQMHRELLKAASCGNSSAMRTMAAVNPNILLGITPWGNTCLHISSIRGHEGFCKDVVGLEESLLANVNFDGETPLVIAVTRGHASLAYFLLGRCCQDLGLRESILQKDTYGCNALHHAIRGGHENLALELIEAEPVLSQGVNKYNESPMFIAVMRDCRHIFEKLLEIPDSAHAGAGGFNALHAAVRNGNSVIASSIMEKRPGLAREADSGGNTPVALALLYNKIEVLRVLLEHDCSLGYAIHSDGFPLLASAAYRGHVDAARELLNHCPDAPYHQVDGLRRTCLHQAVRNGHTEFVQFVLTTPQLQNLVNMRDSKGKTALHHAVHMCNPKIVAALLSHKDIDTTVIDNHASPAAWELGRKTSDAKTLNWNEVSMLTLRADPQDATSIYNLHKMAMKKATKESRKDAKSLTQTYTSNTSLVAILMATITFAAAFTLPGGYSSEAGSEGLPIMSRKSAFQAFLISDTLAMCASFAVAFICIIARWEDYEFLIYYRSFTKKLMWFAYIATSTAFATGLYTVLAPRLHWLAIWVCVLAALLPIVTKLLGEWPVLKLRFRISLTLFDLINLLWFYPLIIFLNLFVTTTVGLLILYF